MTVANGNRYLAENRTEIVPHAEWCLKVGVFEHERVINAWQEKQDQALARGVSGMRMNGCYNADEHVHLTGLWLELPDLGYWPP